MWLVWTVTAASAVVATSCVILLRDDWRVAPRGWQCLAGSGVALALGGLGFIIRFWQPLPGPYIANELYPLGPYVNAWAVSFGFMWLAYGLAFVTLALRGQRSFKIWLAMIATWILAWLPHAIIVLGFLTAGENERSLELYRGWAAEWRGLLALSVSGLILVGHLGLSLAGFVLTGRALLRDNKTPA